MLTVYSRFERPQWHDLKFKSWEDPEWTGEKTISGNYGAEHLCRLLGMFYCNSSCLILVVWAAC